MGRIVSMEKGDNITAIFTRFANATKAVQESLESDGYGIMHNDHLGFILTCPSNLGTGLRAGAMVKLPLFSARPDFKETLKKWASRLAVLLVSTPPPPVVLGISPTLTASVSPKSNCATSLSRDSPRSLNGRRSSKPARRLRRNLRRPNPSESN